MDEFGGSTVTKISAYIGAFAFVVVSTLVWILLQPFCFIHWLFKRLIK